MEQQPPLEPSHPEPIAQAASGGLQKVTELGAIGALLTQVTAGWRARRAGRTADELARQNAELAADHAQLAAARAGWAKARHPEWLADATLGEVARAWGHAAPYEHADQGAAVAMDACEARLREIHPYAMRKYDRLRRSGQSRTEAMMATVPEFFKHPNPRPAPRDAQRDLHLPLPAADGQTPAWWPSLDGVDAAVIHKILGIIGDLNEKAIAAGEGPLTPQDVEMALTNQTNVKPSLIKAVVAGLKEGDGMLPAQPAPADPRSVAYTGPAAADWPSPSARAGVGATVLRQAVGVKGRGPRRHGRPPQAPSKAPKLSP